MHIELLKYHFSHLHHLDVAFQLVLLDLVTMLKKRIAFPHTNNASKNNPKLNSDTIVKLLFKLKHKFLTSRYFDIATVAKCFK